MGLWGDAARSIRREGRVKASSEGLEICSWSDLIIITARQTQLPQLGAPQHFKQQPVPQTLTALHFLLPLLRQHTQFNSQSTNYITSTNRNHILQHVHGRKCFFMIRWNLIKPYASLNISKRARNKACKKHSSLFSCFVVTTTQGGFMLVKDKQLFNDKVKPGLHKAI